MAKRRIYLQKPGGAPRLIFEINQTANRTGVYVQPNRAVYFPNELIERSQNGDSLEFAHEEAMRLDHFSMHTLTGQRHVKTSRSSIAIEPIIGPSGSPLTTVVPLFTLAASAGLEEESSVPNPERDLVIPLPPDTNYIIIDAVLVPRGADVTNSAAGMRISNEDHASVESLGSCGVELDDCSLVMFTRTSNYARATLLYDIFYRQVEGKAVTINRIVENRVLAQVTEVKVVDSREGAVQL